MHIPIDQLSLGNEESDTVLAALASGMIAQGPVTTAFEKEFATYCGVPHAVAISNGTTALHAATLAASVLSIPVHPNITDEAAGVCLQSHKQSQKNELK